MFSHRPLMMRGIARHRMDGARLILEDWPWCRRRIDGGFLRRIGESSPEEDHGIRLP